MPHNKNFDFRIRYLDSVFTSDRKGYTKEDLLDEINEKLNDEGFGTIALRQLGNDIYEMNIQALKQDVELTYKRGEQRYCYSDPEFSLTGIPLKKEDIDLLTQALAILNHIQGIKQTSELKNIIERLAEKLSIKIEDLGDIIVFDQVPDLKGIEHLNLLLNKIIEKQPLKLKYQPFQKDIEIHIVHPYFLKEYNNRWFLFGLNDDLQMIYNYPLDRILKIEEEHIYFDDTKYESPNNYFKDIIGVTLLPGKPQKIRLKFKKPRAYYIVTKPLHSSQKLVDETDEHMIFDIRIIPNREYESMILSFGEDCIEIQ